MNNSKLPFFPTPFSGETVFSVLSRFAKRLKYNGPTILRKLFGRLFSYESYGGFPSRINRISEIVPEGNPWEETWNILKNHTGLPYAIYFYDEVRKRNLKENFSPRSIGLSSMRIPAWPSKSSFLQEMF